MFDSNIDAEITSLFGRELRGKLNDALLLILLTENKLDNNDEFGMTTRQMADFLELPQSTIATVVARLVKKGLVEHSKGRPVTISPTGVKIGNEMIRHHRLLEVALVDQLKLSHDDMHNEAIKLMLIVNCKTINKIADKYNHPSECPGGSPIPDSPLCSR